MFTQKELVNIVNFMIPKAWLNQMLAADMRPYAMSLQDLKAYLSNLQKNDEFEAHGSELGKIECEKFQFVQKP